MKLVDFNEFALTKAEMKSINGQSAPLCKSGSCMLVQWDSSLNIWSHEYGICKGSGGPLIITPKDMGCFCMTAHHSQPTALKNGARSACYA